MTYIGPNEKVAGIGGVFEPNLFTVTWGLGGGELASAGEKHCISLLPQRSIFLPPTFFSSAFIFLRGVS